MVDLIGFSVGVLPTLIAVIFQYISGAEQQPAEKTTDEVIEQFINPVLEINFLDQMNRAVGGGVAVVPSTCAGTEDEVEVSDEENEKKSLT